MKPKQIKTKRQYLSHLKRFEEIFSAKQGTKQSEEANILSSLILEYEKKHFIIKKTE